MKIFNNKSKQEIEKIAKEENKKLNNKLLKHFGISKSNENALEIQKEIRNEWN